MCELTTTLKSVYDHCTPGHEDWARLLKNLGKKEADDEPLTLIQILKADGIQAAIWMLLAADGRKNAIRLFGCYCARQALPVFEHVYSYNPALRLAIETSERYARGRASEDDLLNARLNAWTAARDSYSESVSCAARAAAYSADNNDCLHVYFIVNETVLAIVRFTIAAKSTNWDDLGTVTKNFIKSAIWNTFTSEFVRLCKLEGKYGEVI
jgi:hypothetical protein